MKVKLQLAVLLFFSWGLAPAYGVPSFARQTGLTCNVCHRNPPELTAFGRNFKIQGYTLASASNSEKIGNAKDLQLTMRIPISAMVLFSNTSFEKRQPAAENSAANFPQQLSIFLAGKFASHFGGMAQFTYTHADDHFGMDNTDIRYANQRVLKGKDLSYGITLNNNPTVEDLWNSTPAWGFPWISSSSGVSPIASPLITGALAQDVAGVGAYSLWNNHLYTCISAYRSEHAGASTPVTGEGNAYNISGAAPYWRAAWQQSWGSNYLMVGSYGLYVSSFPGTAAGAADRYLDPAFDLQYQRTLGPNEFDIHATYIHERSNLSATFGAGGATVPLHTLSTYRGDAVYHWRDKWNVVGAYFATSGTADQMLFAQAPLTGSNNGSPNTSGYLAQLAYWPAKNVNLDVNYSGYVKFNGSRMNYDGAGRDASDNNTVYAALWLSF